MDPRRRDRPLGEAGGSPAPLDRDRPLAAEVRAARDLLATAAYELVDHG
ncbi:hypothetical protein [Salinispora sp. H7-4]|nr:hypothetical protein [Salinispora sp. H7-4]NYT96208.1 hypothetical protein [Salinispora sp. H7-4]